MAAPGGATHCGQNIHMGENIMLADGQFNNWMALFFQSPSLVKNIPPIGSFACQGGYALCYFHPATWPEADRFVKLVLGN